jgi:hypothetical protein
MKNIEELKATLEGIFGAGVNFKLYLGVATPDGFKYFHADLNRTSTDAICSSYVASIRTFFANAELSVQLLSEIDNRDNVILGYDFPEEPQAFSGLRELRDAPAVDFFSFDQYNISDVKTLVIKISSAVSSVLFFKQLYPVSLIKQNQILVWKSENRFEYVASDILRISGGFDLLLLEDEFYISGLKKFEKSFGFDEIAKRLQRETAETIIALGLVDDLKSYLIDGHAPKRDMLRVSRSEVLQLPIQQIILFATSIEAKLGLKIVNDKIQLTSKESVKRLVKLLNDDYLKSGLTQNDYDSLAKNKLA